MEASLLILSKQIRNQFTEALKVMVVSLSMCWKRRIALAML